MDPTVATTSSHTSHRSVSVPIGITMVVIGVFPIIFSLLAPPDLMWNSDGPLQILVDAIGLLGTLSLPLIAAGVVLWIMGLSRNREQIKDTSGVPLSKPHTRGWIRLLVIAAVLVLGPIFITMFLCLGTGYVGGGCGDGVLMFWPATILGVVLAVIGSLGLIVSLSRK